MARKMKTGGIIALVVIVLVALIAYSGFYRVGQGEQALVLTFC